MNNPWDEINVPSIDVFSRLVDESHPLDFFWARDQRGCYLFIYRADKDSKLPEKYPTLTGIEIISTPEIETGRNRLVLLLKSKKDWELFLSLCRDLVSSTRDLKSKNLAPEVILRRLNRWQDFLSKERNHLLSESEIKGLIGELAFMNEHVAKEYGIGNAVTYWQGPLDLPQDFNIQDIAIEVKCQLGVTSPKIRISSAEQLCSQLPENFLYVLTLGKAEPDNNDAVNLYDFVELIRRQLEIKSPDKLEYFNNLLYQTRYVDNEEYRSFSYIKTGEKMYKVDNDFPRICPETLPSGVSRLTYDIDLISCEGFLDSPEWVNLT